ncbi:MULTISPECIES: DUF1829 domain-containing protein [Zhenhengia]|uniref:DUF1829 domain-containing protein n=1 Tax=Zhenhengia TaxID=2944196 RepID=UPI002913BB72|nr:DUF1829 domain-containing protein [Zhenhengia yiwuensis]MDU6361317.1 DUF1829 domain-containing protein [Clostridiales bacterium]MDY3367508.1 DUF1829 domain-containing protein [Zhenhengia yiwuensis]
MNPEIESFSQDYLNWLKSNIVEAKISNTISRITFPFLDRNNDHTEVYIISKGDGNYTVTDDSNTISELELSGFSFSDKRTEIFNTILNAHGVCKDENDALYVECTRETLPLKKHMLLQCMIKVSDLFMLSRQSIKSVFLEDVSLFLEDHDIRCSSNLGITGKSSLINNFDFIISKSKKAPERLINVCNNLDIMQAKSFVFTWNDTKEVRKPDTKFYIFVNTTDKKASQTALTALKHYNIEPILWHEREDYIDVLSA